MDAARRDYVKSMQKITLKLGENDWQVYLRDEADQSVFNEIFKLKEYRSADDTVKAAKYPVVDVGAHAGFFSMYCRAINKKIKIFAVEPEPGNLKLLKQHLDENKISGVKVVAGALAGQTGDGELFLSEDSHNHFVIPTEVEGSLFPSLRDSSAPSSSARNDKETIRIKTFTFSDFCKKNKITKISLLKMDIEGGEYELFDGMSEADFAMVNYVILEYHRGSEHKEIAEKLRANGFGVQVFPSHFDKTMGFVWANNKRQVAQAH